jgi:hypothetical protein
MIINNAPIKKSLEDTNTLNEVKKIKTPIGPMFCLNESQVRVNQLSIDQGYWFLLYLETMGYVSHS